LNVGTGTSEPRQVRAAWTAACAFFERSGHVPESARSSLKQAKGHTYYLFDPRHLADCQRSGALIVGDALGVAHPLTAEGILPGVLSGRLAGEAVASGSSAYPRAVAEHPVMRDYALARELLRAGIALRDGWQKRRSPITRLENLPIPGRVLWSGMSKAATARAFAWMFSGQQIPCARVLRVLLRAARVADKAGT
jgi:flavin-dependent dehydrogenase